MGVLVQSRGIYNSSCSWFGTICLSYFLGDTGVSDIELLGLARDFLVLFHCFPYWPRKAKDPHGPTAQIPESLHGGEHPGGGEGRLTHTDLWSYVSLPLTPQSQLHGVMGLECSFRVWIGCSGEQGRMKGREVNCIIHLQILGLAEYVNDHWVTKYQKSTDLVMIPQFSVSKIFNFPRKDFTPITSLHSHAVRAYKACVRHWSLCWHVGSNLHSKRAWYLSFLFHWNRYPDSQS